MKPETTEDILEHMHGYIVSAESVMRMKLLNTDSLLMLAASLLLLVVNWLAFHDFREAHTVRDWFKH